MSGLEALAAFGLACNVMQVISFVHEGVQVGKAIYDTGIVDPNLAHTTDCLAKGLDDLKMRLETAPKPLNRDEQDLLDIALGSLDTGSDLKAELDKIAGVASKGKQSAALRGWLRTVLGGKRKIEKMEKMMRSRREVLENRLLLRICNKSDAILIQQQDSFNELNIALQGFVQACGQGQTSLHHLILTESESAKAHVSSETNHLHQSLNSSIVAESDRVQVYVSSRLEESTIRIIEEQQHKTLLGSLRYETLNERRNQIKSPHEDTFEWIFQEKEDHDSKLEPLSLSATPWDSFVDWLGSDEQQPYWISGKAGSGKSTLMKFLIEDRRTKTALDASNPDTTILAHFLWAVGQPLDKNVKGIFCSLLHQLLLECSAFCQQILERFPNSRHKRSPSDWSREELFSVIMDTFSTHSQRFCIFLDGLDEIDPRDGQSALIALIDKLCVNPQLRLCLSSRPEPALQRRFGSCPRLRVQDLTQNDISRYAKAVLADHSVKEKSLFEELVSRVCEKAQGVFLWAALALRSVQTGLSNEDDIIELSRRLELLPDDLNSLYQEMWRRLNDSQEVYQVEGARYFNLMLEFLKAETKPLLLHFILVYEPLLAAKILENEVTSSSMGDVVETHRRTANRLQTRCAGILEVSAFNQVTFIHRSAAEFLTNTPEGKQIRQADQLSSGTCQLNLLRGSLCFIKLVQYNTGGLTCNPVSQILHFVRPYFDGRRSISAENLVELIRLSRVLCGTDRWEVDRTVLRPDFLGLAVYIGLLDQASAELEHLSSQAPTGTRLSASYRDYLLGAACSEPTSPSVIGNDALSFIRALLDCPVTPSNGHNHIYISEVLEEGTLPYYSNSTPLADYMGMLLWGCRYGWSYPNVDCDWSYPNVECVLVKLFEAGCNLASRTVIVLSRIDSSNTFEIGTHWMRKRMAIVVEKEEHFVFEVARSFFLQLYLHRRLATAQMRTSLPSSLSMIASAVGGADAPMPARLLAIIPRTFQYRHRLDEVDVLIPSTTDGTDFIIDCLETSFSNGRRSFHDGRRPEVTVLDLPNRLQHISDGSRRVPIDEFEESLARAGHLIPRDDVVKSWPPRPYSTGGGSG